jgi:NAD(P)-dependent dehydrogenase (short-subunit alcohol dehydrogenase family)
VTRFEGRLAVVTGASRGIGAAIARQLSVEGARVWTTAKSAVPASAPGRVSSADFSDEEATNRFAELLAEEPVDILVNNAGINIVSPFADIAPQDFDRVHRINVRAPLVLSQAVLPGMRRRGWGRIVNITSVFGSVSKEGRASYSASKFGLDGMTAALAAEVARDGVLANCVAPGFVDTELTRRVLGDDGIADMVSRIPIGRLARAEEIARLVVWLAGPENTYVSGQSVVIDGGFTRV